MTGEPGIGKTSLSTTSSTEMHCPAGERPTIARGRCSESLAGAEAYLPILEVARRAAAIAPAARRSSAHRRCAHLVRAGDTAVDREAAARAEGATVQPPPAPSQERMKRELGALLQEISRTQPVVLFIDDLHWADVSTIDILNYLAGRFADMRVLIVTSYRPSDMALAKHPFLAIRSDLQSRGLFEEIASRVSRHVRRRALPGAGSFPTTLSRPAWPRWIHAKTEGSPLFMVDLVRYLRDTGGIVLKDGTWIAGARHVGRAEGPAGVGARA